MADLLLEAMQARQKGDNAQARQLLAQALVQDPRNEGAWMLMSEVVEEVRLKRNCLQRVLMINPANEAAKIALMKLDTSPLGPVRRGERYEPVVPPSTEKTPPFTPPFTWTGDDTQLQAIGDLTYPDLTGEQVNQTLETPTTFDWAAESSEPDKTIEKIFDKVSNPEAASQPMADTDLNSLEQQTTKAASDTGLSEQEKEARSIDQLAGAAVAASSEPLTVGGEESEITGEAKQWLEAGISEQESESELNEAEPLLWDNPKAKNERLVILGINSIIYANPVESDMPHILGLFEEKKMMRDLLGEGAGTIKLESIERLTVNPARSELTVYYRLDQKSTSHQLIFSSPQTRDEALSAMEQRLGDDFTRRTRTFSMKRKILPPLVCVLVIVAFGWVLIGGLPLLSQVTFFKTGILQLILYNIQYYVDKIGTFNILLIGVMLAALCLIWLVANLSKPTEMVFIERKT